MASADHIRRLLEEALSARDAATLAVSGGSTPRLMFNTLARSGLRWDRIHLFWVDERCVPPTDSQSNYRLAEESLIAPARIPRVNVHRIEGERRPEEAVKRYTDEIRRYFGLGATELPRFDVIHRGIGPDAHTASLFPGSPLIDDRECISAAAWVEKFQQWRITLLPGVLMAARHTVFLAAGADKAEAVRNVFGGEHDPRRYPAQIGHGAWFLDQAAAALLD